MNINSIHSVFYQMWAIQNMRNIFIRHKIVIHDMIYVLWHTFETGNGFFKENFAYFYFLFHSPFYISSHQLQQLHYSYDRKGQFSLSCDLNANVFIHFPFQMPNWWLVKYEWPKHPISTKNNIPKEPYMTHLDA